MSDLERELQSIEFTTEERKTGVQATDDLQRQLDYIIQFHDIWARIEAREEKLDDIHRDLLRYSNLRPKVFQTVCEDGFENTEYICDLLENKEMYPYIEESIKTTNPSDFNKWEDLLSQSFYFEDEDFRGQISAMSSLTVPFPSETSVQSWYSKGTDIFTQGQEFLLYSPIEYQKMMDEKQMAPYEDLEPAELNQLSRWDSYLLEDSELVREFDDTSNERSDGGSLSMRRTAGTVGQILAGTYAVGHDSFVDPNHSSIIAGTGLISSGLHDWPDTVDLEERLDRIQDDIEDIRDD